MNIGIVTFHDVVNYGGVLQAYALQKTISSRYDCKCEIVNYCNPLFASQYSPFSLKLLRHPKSLPYKLMLAPYRYTRRKKFQKFASDNFVYGSSKIKRSGLEQATDKYDALITGSDQVWNFNCTGNDYTYLLDFAKNGQKKYSYAASFGKEIVPDLWKEKYKELLADFDDISVREASGAKMIKEMFGKAVNVVPDPTLLLSAEHWHSIEKKYEGLPDNYTLVIQMGGSIEDLWSFAKKISNCNPVVYINLAYKEIKGLINVFGASPEEWIYLVEHAQNIVSNSFHGCVFSILFHKNFYYELSKGKDSNTRIENLMDMLDIKNRELSDLEVLSSEICYDKVEKNLEKLRKCGYKYLDKIFGE